jgi:hypothetical protein
VILVTFLVALVIVSLACSFFGAYVAGEKGREPMEGGIIGFFFGPIGVLIVALLPSQADSGSRVERRPSSNRRRSTRDTDYRAVVDREDELRAATFLSGLEPQSTKPGDPTAIPDWLGQALEAESSERGIRPAAAGGGLELKRAPALPADYQLHGDLVRWQCECGEPRYVKLALSGRITVCPNCKAETVVPSARR